MSEHIEAERALALVSLSEHDEELVLARAHARDCPACQALLAQSAAMLQQLDASMTLPEVRPALRERVVQARAPSSRLSQLMIIGFALLSFLLIWKNHAIGVVTVAPASRCAGYEAAFALVPLVVGAALSRMGRVQLSPARFASYTMGFAVAAQLQLRTHCAAHDLSMHLFVFHFLVVLAMGAVGAGAARLLAARP